MRRTSGLSSAVLTGLLAVAFASGCGSVRSASIADGGPALPAQALQAAPAGIMELPAPMDLMRKGSSVDKPSSFCLGGDLDPAMAANQQLMGGPGFEFCRLQPNLNAPGFKGAAYAAYQLSPSAGQPAQSLTLNLDYEFGGSLSSRPWIAVADFETNRWEWHACDGVEIQQVEGLAERHIGPQGSVLVLVLQVESTNGCDIWWLRLGPNLAPDFEIAAAGPLEVFNSGAVANTVSVEDLRDWDALPGFPVIELLLDEDGDGSFDQPQSHCDLELGGFGRRRAGFQATDSLGASRARYVELTSNWVHSLQGPNPGSDGLTAVAAGPAGSSYACGSLHSLGPGGYDAAVLKYDAQGSLQWAKVYGSSKIDHARSIAVDQEGNAYVTGTFDTDATYGKPFVIKLNPDGDLLWQKFYNHSCSPRPALAVTAAGIGLALPLVEPPGSEDFVLYASLSPDGNQNCAVELKLDGVALHSTSICSSAAGVIIAGEADAPEADLQATQMFAMCLQPETGAVNWQIQLGAVGAPEGVNGISAADGNVYLAGQWDISGTGNGVLACLSQIDGSPLYVREYAAYADYYEDFNCCLALPEGGCLVGAQVLEAGGSYDFGLLEIDVDGRLVRARGYGSEDHDALRGLALGEYGSLLLAGKLSGFNSGWTWHAPLENGDFQDYPVVSGSLATTAGDSPLMLISSMGLFGNAQSPLSDQASGGTGLMRYWY